MRKTLSFATLIAAILSAAPAIADTTLTPMQVASLAPADQYFGKIKMSILGIRNSIKDIANAATTEPDKLSDLYHKLTLVEDSLADLKSQFPHDTWIPNLGVGLADAFAKIGFEDSAVHENDALDWVIAEYPNSIAAKTAISARTAVIAITKFSGIPLEGEVSQQQQPK
jgi:ABC-type microcin C transport system permease subunit YejB